MYKSLGLVVLKSGEETETAVIAVPDEQWRSRLETLLFHKEDLWRWQVNQLLSHPIDVQAFHYVVHRDGKPFSHILTVESQGVGILGHVWTEPQDRGQGAASSLMQLQMEDFRSRGGKALFLGTGYDSNAYHIYQKNGFVSVEPQSGVMAYFSSSKEQFEAGYFAPGPANVLPLEWSHWASSSALFAGPWPGVVRSVPFGLLGKQITESPLLPAIRHHDLDPTQSMRALVLQKQDTGAVVGLAGWSWDPTWPDTHIADVYCHPDFWHRGEELLALLDLPRGARVVAYADADLLNKHVVLEAAGFREIARLPQWLLSDAAKTGFTDVLMLERSGW